MTDINIMNNNNDLDLFFKILSQARFGKISLFLKDKNIFQFEGKEKGPEAIIEIHNKECVKNFFLKGDLGWAESYIYGHWDTDNLSDFLEWGAKNFHSFSNYIRGKWYVILYLRLRHFFNMNSKKGSKKNIKSHYDLGNDFYKKWLDQSMTYSSALYKNESQNLYEAQINKFYNLSKLCEIKENEDVLEIGCGWGSYSIYLAKMKRVNVTAVTISKKQFEEVSKRIFNENLTDKINVKLLDYRDIKGKFDKIVSIEMFEAVGEKYWPVYFKSLKRNLKPTGLIGLQTITIDEKYFKSYRKFPDFIQTYIFPGGMLPSEVQLNKSLSIAGLRIYNKKLFGNHYAKTLNEWKKSFNGSWKEIKEIGFDINFKRLWEYYLCYCEGGFKSGNINVGQFLIGKE